MSVLGQWVFLKELLPLGHFCREFFVSDFLGFFLHFEILGLGEFLEILFVKRLVLLIKFFPAFFGQNLLPLFPSPIVHHVDVFLVFRGVCLLPLLLLFYAFLVLFFVAFMGIVDLLLAILVSRVVVFL